MSATTQPERVWYSPAVRALIAQLGIDPVAVTGTGRDGRVTLDDMLRASNETRSQKPGAGKGVSQPSGDLIPISRIRRMTAENLMRTIREAPMERVYTTVDWTALIGARAAMRAAFEAEHGVPLTYMPFILRGIVVAARRYPRVNSRWMAEGPETLPALNIGVAVSTDDGLHVPIVHHAEDFSVVGLARALHRVISAARERRLTITDIQGGTITVTNPGPFGTLRSAPIIPPGQSAILGVDGVRAVPMVVDGAIAIRSVATIGLTYDARLCDEGDAVPCLGALREWLEGGFIAETRQYGSPA